MTPAQATDVIARLIANLRAQRGDLGTQVERRPASHYHDPSVFTQEQARLFRRLPLLIGHASQAPAAGDFFTVSFAGPPLLIVRQADGSLKAFLNACRHRGAPLTAAASGHLQSLVCPYHGWRYTLDGRLANITARECFPGIEPAAHGLVELPLEVCAGLVFVVTTPDAALDARAWLGPVADLLTGFDLASHRHFRTEQIDTGFNWKIGVEGSLETYHFRSLHAKTVSALFDGMATIYDHWAPHQRQCVAKPTLRDADSSRDPLALLRAQILQTYLIFPCTLVSVTNDHVLLTFFYPRGVTGCTMIYTLLTPALSSTDAQRAHWERTWALTRSVLSEDFDVQEGIQRATASAAAPPLIVGLFEQALARFHAALDRYLAT